jgi:hypothetical protein
MYKPYKGGNIQKSRERFLKIFKKLHEEYAPYVPNIDIYLALLEVKEGIKEKTLREALIKEGVKANYSQIDYQKLTRVVINDNSVFGVFYDWEQEGIESLFRILNKTALFLEYYEYYGFSRLRTWDERIQLIKKYETIIEDLNYIKSTSCIEKLEKRISTLKQIDEGVQLTRRKIFENLLFNVFFIMIEMGEVKIPSINNKIPPKVARIVSSIIEEYFNDNEHFGKNMTATRFDKYWYRIEISRELSLFHTPQP